MSSIDLKAPSSITCAGMEDQAASNEHVSAVQCRVLRSTVTQTRQTATSISSKLETKGCVELSTVMLVFSLKEHFGCRRNMLCYVMLCYFGYSFIPITDT